MLLVSGRELLAVSEFTTPKDKEFYYSAIATLFKPHRDGTLLPPGKSSFEVYHDFICGSSDSVVAKVEEFETILSDYHRSNSKSGALEAAETAEAHLLTTRAASTPLSNVMLDEVARNLMQQDNDSNMEDLSFNNGGVHAIASTIQSLLLVSQNIVD